MRVQVPEAAVAAARETWQHQLVVGAHVRFWDDRPFWWIVRATSDRFAVLTRHATFQPKGVLCYTIVDWAAGVRGPCNLIGQGFGDGTYSDAECAAILAELNADDVEVSHRNNVKTMVEAVR